MDTTQTLTATEVIDRVHTARGNEHQAAVGQLELAVQWDYKRHGDGSYPWMRPTGHQYDVVSVSRRPPPQPSRRRT